ncbi:hypothetical protein BC629DRAFT_1594266 [Irpex lacteus]|nr:hypothetical protein BC629DRAFT_1594266 [Irpex lacteus]
MSDRETDTEQLSVEIDITAELTSPILSQKKSRGPPPKETKNKEFSLKLYGTQASYVELLQTILNQHGKKQYRVKSTRPYRFKYSLPKTARKKAIDVEHFEEYQSMIRSIIKKSAPSVTLLVQFEDVKRRVSMHESDGNADSGDEEGDEEAEDSDHDLRGSGRIREEDLSELDVILAENRNQILKKWGNGHNSDATYVYPDGVQLPLTPAMIQDWAIAMKDNIATVNDPPHTAMFDPNNKRPVLNSRRIVSTPTPAPAIDVNAFASVFAPITSAVAELAKANALSNPPRTPSKRPRTNSLVATPSSRPPDLDSKLTHSPNSLARFCKFLKDSRGVRKAPQYFMALRDYDYAPDILGEVDVKELTEVGISIGDAHRIRKAAPEWLRSRSTREPEAIETDPDFCQHVVGAANILPSIFDDNAPGTGDRWEEKSVHYKLEHVNGTRNRWWSGPLLRNLGERREDDDYIEYRDPATLEWRPIPPGFTAPAKDDEADENGHLIQ